MRINVELLSLLSFLLCFSDVGATKHRHQKRASDFASHARFGMKSKRHAISESTNDHLNTIASSSTSGTPDLFKEYLSRGMYTCTSKYVHTIKKLHDLIKTSFEEYQDCEKIKRDESKNFPKTSMKYLDQLLEEWKEEEEEAKKLRRPSSLTN